MPQLETAADELRHELLLKFYRQYLEDRGVIFVYAEANLQHTGFDGLLQGIMPITPRILLGQGKCTDDTGGYFSYYGRCRSKI